MATPQVVVRNTNLRREVRKADPEYDRDSRRPVAYRFSNGREFKEVEGSAYEDES